MKTIFSILLFIICLYNYGQFVEVDVVIGRDSVNSPLISGDSANITKSISNENYVNTSYLDVVEPLNSTIKLHDTVIIAFSGDTLKVYFDSDTVNYYHNNGYHKFLNRIMCDSILVNGVWYKSFASVPGSNREIIFNDNGLLGASSNFQYDPYGYGELYLGLNSLIGNAYFTPTGNDNYIFGSGGVYSSIGTKNIFLGSDVCNNCATSNSVIIGSNGGGASGGFTGDDITSNYAVIIGASAGGQFENGVGAMMIGYQAGTYLQTGCDYNTVIGYQSHRGQSISPYSDYVNHSTGLGFRSLYSIISGDHNVAIGSNPLYSITVGNNNVALGNFSGYSNISGSRNVFLGDSAGYYETLSNKLYITNRTIDTLIYGEFDNSYLKFNADVDITGNLNFSGLIDIFGVPSKNQITRWYDENTLTGDDSLKWTGYGFNILTKLYNNNFGYLAGASITSGYGNNNIGYLAGRYINTGYYNTNIGYQSGYLITSGYDNNNVGYLSGYSISTGYFNNNFGSRAGNDITTASNNSNFGHEAGANISIGNSNSNFGAYTGAGTITGYNNSNFGSYAGLNINGYCNSNFGSYAGQNITTGNDNVCIGDSAGYTLTTESGQLFLENSPANKFNTLIWGDFLNDSLRLNASTYIRTNVDTSNINVIATDNGIIQKSVNVYASMYLDNSTQTVTINTINVWEKVADFTQGSVFENATYTQDTIWIDYDGIYSISVDIGGLNELAAQDYELGVSVNGVDPTSEQKQIQGFFPADEMNCSFNFNYRLYSGDYLVMKIRDVTDTRDLYPELGHLTIIKLN